MTLRASWIRGLAASAAIAVLVAACGGSAATPTPASQPPTTQAPASAAPASQAPASAEASAAPSAAAAAQTAGFGIPLNQACNAECVAALQLTQDPKSIKGKVGLSWSTTSFQYGANAVANSKWFFEQNFPQITLYEVEGKNDAATQSGQIDDLVARGIDVLIVSPVDAAAIGPAVQRAIAAGVKVIASDRNVTGTTGLSTYIGADNVSTGISAAKLLEQIRGDKPTKVIEISGSLGASPTIDRAKGFRDEIAANGPNIKIIDTQTGNYDQTTALKVAEDLLQKYPKGTFDAFFVHGDQMAISAIQAIKEAGRQDDVIVVGVDDSAQALAAIQAGTYAGAASYPATFREHTVAAAKLLEGDTLPARIGMDSLIVTKDNAVKFLPGQQ